MPSRTEEINEFMLTTFKENDIEDTIEHRLAFLLGLQKAWREDEDIEIEKTFYQLALSSEIMMLRMKISFDHILRK